MKACLDPDPTSTFTTHFILRFNLATLTISLIIEVKKLCDLETKLPFYKLWYRLPHTEQGGLYRAIHLKLSIEVGPADDLHFIMTYEGRKVGDVRPNYRPFA